MTDLLASQGNLFLGSRLRRLGEQMQADVATLCQQGGIDIQPNQFQLLLALVEDGFATVGSLSHRLGISQPAITRTVTLLRRAGHLEAGEAGDDRRQRPLRLTPRGRSTLARARALVWPLVRHAADTLVENLSGTLPELLSAIEQRLAHQSLTDRALDPGMAPLAILPYDGSVPQRAAFKAINAQWITGMFGMEPADEAVLDDPDGMIIAPGGAILFVSAAGKGIVGTAALRRQADGAVELTKMGVRECSRGTGAGAFLLAATIGRGTAMTQLTGCGPLYLLTNRRCATAIHLYEQMGFVHDAAIMADYGARYQRCDVAMRFAG